MPSISLLKTLSRFLNSFSFCRPCCGDGISLGAKYSKHVYSLNEAINITPASNNNNGDNKKVESAIETTQTSDKMPDTEISFSVERDESDHFFESQNARHISDENAFSSVALDNSNVFQIHKMLNWSKLLALALLETYIQYS